MLHHYFLGLPFRVGGNSFLAHGYLAVDLFFVLSGFVLALNYAEIFEGGFSLARYRIFLERRIARVYPLYFVLTLFAAVLVAIGWLGWSSSFQPHVALIWNLFMVQVWNLGPSLDPPAWSISAEWTAYLLFPIALRLAYTSSSRVARVVAILAAITVVFLAYLPSGVLHRVRPEALMDYHDSFRASPVFRCIPEFVLGIWIARRYLKERPSRLLKKHFVPEFLALGIIGLNCCPRTDSVIVLLFPALILALAYSKGILSSWLGGRILHHFGEISYSIYLVHELMGGLIGWVHTHANSHNLAHGQTYGAGVAILLTYAVSNAAYFLIEKPGRRILRTRFERIEMPVAVPAAEAPGKIATGDRSPT
jgi:peptidoglycan/LPS O-acetylase OafA/YrhL